MNKAEELAYIREESLSVKTIDDLKSLTESTDVFYRYGEGYRIQALIETESQFIDFLQKAGMTYLWDDWVPFFINDIADFNKWFEYKDTVRRSELDTVETVSWDDQDPEIVSETIFPTVEKEVLFVSYNQYSDKPFRVNKHKVLVYGEEDIRVKDEIKEKFPCVVTFVSQATFDRCRSIEGNDLTIISLKELTSKPVFA